MISSCREVRIASSAPLLAMGACSTAERPLLHVQIDTLPSGLVQVVNDGLGQWTPETAWTLVEDLRLGSLEQAGPELFSQVASILTDSTGQIFILDSQTQEVRAFSSTGQHAKTLGGRGDGPGELAGASGMSWAPDGRLWVWGGNARRYDVLDLAGQQAARYERTLSGIVTPWSGGFTGDGRYVDFGVTRETTGQERVGTSLVTYANGRTTISPEAFTPPDRRDPLPGFEYWAEVNEKGQLKRPALKGLALHVAEDGIWFAHPDSFRISKRTFGR